MTVSSVLRGVIKNSLAAEYGNVLRHWVGESAGRSVRRDRLMVEVDEAFEIVVPIFVGIADQLSRYRHLPSLCTEMLNYDPIDGSIIVRISDG
ncbi:hypothetical protein D3C81_1470490 [compost metagenome]